MQKQHINDSLCGLAYTLAIVDGNSLLQFVLIEDFPQISDPHRLQ